MKKKHAIQVLRKQINKLDHNTNLNNKWTVQTKSYLKAFFGTDSEQYEYFKDFRWKHGVADDPEKHVKPVSIFLNDCIEVIQDIGLKKEEKKNFLSRIPDWSIIPIIASLIFIGGILGRYQKDIAFIRMEEKIEKLQDSLSVAAPNNIPDKVKQVDSEKKY